MKTAYRTILLPLLLAVTLATATTTTYAQSATRCDVGLLYQISYQESWGDSHAVVVEVLPESPAARAGLRPCDVILAIEGQDTRKLSEEAITQMILDPSRETVRLTIRRFGTPSEEVTLHKECMPVNLLSEDLIAEAFGMYSLEDVTTRRFTMPFIYTLPTKKDFMQYGTFSFADPVVAQETGARAVANELVGKGLKELPEGGQLQVRYEAALETNPDYRPGSEANLDPGFRNYLVTIQDGDYNVGHYPFLSINTPTFSGKYRLTVNIELWDSAEETKVWSVTARELLNQEFDPNRYVANFAYLMFANFPFVRYMMNPSFVLHRKQYLYTGVSYEEGDLRRIGSVAPGSPAEAAGLQRGDLILSINGRPLDGSVEKMSNTYKEFLKKTWKYRSKSTIYPDDHGFRQCMYWDPKNYSEIAKEFDQPDRLTAFSYLFAHNPYILTTAEKMSASGTDLASVIFEVERDGVAEPIIVHPELKNFDYIELK